MTKPGDNGYSHLATPPVRWDEGRDTRGATGSATTPRCTVRGCPVRWASGPDRPCAEHKRDEEIAAHERKSGEVSGHYAVSNWMTMSDAERRELLERDGD